MKRIFRLQYTVLLALTLCFLYSCQHTKPDNLNNEASILELGDLHENPLLMGVITTSVNLNNKTMSTLYGNTIAIDFAKKNSGIKYPEGSVLYEVTWEQQPDSVWFGANIPGVLISVEKIDFNKESTPFYTIYEGSPLRTSKNHNANDRLDQIISQRFAVTP